MEKMMPVVFVGHGSPLNAIENNEYSRTWARLGKLLPRPKAILCISAHWTTKGSRVTSLERPHTIHDFFDFPGQLFDKRYPAPGSKELCDKVRKLLAPVKVLEDREWGLDHGTWSVLTWMYPEAEIPVVQLSLDLDAEAKEHYRRGGKLSPLRKEGVLLMGSGNLVHNPFEAVSKEGFAYPWALQFDREVEKRILSRDHKSLIDYWSLGQAARMSIPTNEHFLPALYVLGASEKGEHITFFNAKVTLGSVSMRGFVIGLEKLR
ncbi:MAG: 4,5-DOPA dioxygenase extradiol [Methanomassiliicoccales archaeon]